MLGRAGGLLSYFTRHGTAANLILVLLLAAGAAAIPNMRAQFFPDVIIDNVTVSVNWSGAGAEDIDAGVVQIMEPALLTVEGVASSQATSREGFASIRLEFEPGWDMARAADDVQTAVDQITTLPAEAETPNVRRGAWRDRVTDVVVTGPVGVDQLARFTDEFVARLFLEGVTRATIRGIADPQVVIEVTSADLVKHDVTIREIADAVGQEAETDPAGDVAGANARVRTGVAKRTPDELAQVVLRSNPDGSTLSVGDVATIRSEGVDRERAYFVGDNSAISIRVDRTDGGDAISLQAQVEEVAAEVQAGLPEGVTIDLIRTRSELITGRLNILLDNALLGLALVVSLLFLFLNARTAFWVAAGIPVALMGAIALMFAAGLTINMISLFALIITLGIVVDDAIVVGEHADFRARVLKEPPVEAAENAAKRMSMPVFSATLTTIIAFYGLALIEGRFGDLIADIPFTVIVVLIASLIECFLILPNHMSHALKERGTEDFSRARVAMAAAPMLLLAALATSLGYYGLIGLSGFDDPDLPLVAAGGAGALAALFLVLPRRRKVVVLEAMSRHGFDLPSHIVNRGLDAFRRFVFRPLMAGVITARYPVFAGILVILVSQITLFIQGDVNWRFFNAPEQGSVSGNFAMLPGSTREDTIEVMRQIQATTEELGAKYEAEHGLNPLDYVLAEVGGGTGRALAIADTKTPDQLGSIAIELIDADLRPYSSRQFVAELQDAAGSHPMLETLSFRSWASGPGGDSLDVQITGAEAPVLKAAAEALKTRMAQFGEVSALEDDLAYDKEELVLDLTPQGAALGFSIDGIGRVLRDRLNGVEAASFPSGVRSATIQVELPEGELTADFLDRTQMRSPSGVYVPLADIVTVTSRTGFSTIRRENGLHVVSVTGDISEDDAARAQEIIEQTREAILPKLESDFGVTTRLSGLAEQENEFLTDALLGFGLCLLGIYLVLSWIFSSWTRPAVVMAIIPFGLVGTIYGHYQWDVPLSMFTVVGLIGMTGIIINDSIVLVTTVDEYSEERGLVPAIIDAASDRLRPVLLTTLTTVLGLAPLLFETSQQAQFLRPTVITLVYGLAFGMVLVLLLVPALLASGEDLKRMSTAMRRALKVPSRAKGMGWGVNVIAALMAALFVATMGMTALTGGMPAQLVSLLPFDPPGTNPMAVAMAVFVLGSAVLTLAGWLVLALGFGLRRRMAG